MIRLPEDLEDALRAWSNIQHSYCGRKVRYVGKVYGEDWPQRGDVGTIVEVTAINGVAVSPFIISWPGMTFNIQPLLDAIEFV